jgi:hypothetical protein
MSAFSSGFGRELMILRKTPFFIRNATPTFTGDFTLFFRVHRSESTSRSLPILYHLVLLIDKSSG